MAILDNASVDKSAIMEMCKQACNGDPDRTKEMYKEQMEKFYGGEENYNKLSKKENGNKIEIKADKQTEGEAFHKRMVEAVDGWDHEKTKKYYPNYTEEIANRDIEVEEEKREKELAMKSLDHEHDYDEYEEDEADQEYEEETEENQEQYVDEEYYNGSESEDYST